MERANINFVYVDGEKSHLSELRGRNALSVFDKYWRRLANVSFAQVSKNRFSDFDIGDANIIWLDNVVDSSVLRKISDLKSREGSDVRVVYALDDLVWEGVGGKATTLRDVSVVEALLDLCDTIVVNNVTLYQWMVKNHIIKEDKDAVLIPTPLSDAVFPTRKEHRKHQTLGVTSVVKPKVLVKGAMLSPTVQQFISTNYRACDITIASIGDLTPHINGLIKDSTVKHIKHWANPEVDCRNAMDLIAIERDGSYDFTIISRPANLADDLYHLTLGDEDALFAIASGSIPVSEVDHIGYPDSSLFKVSGLTFGPSTTADELSDIIRSNSVWNKYNEALSKCVSQLQTRLVGAPESLKNYYTALIGSVAASEASAKAQAEYDAFTKAQEQQDSVPTDVLGADDFTDTPDNVIEVDFGNKDA